MKKKVMTRIQLGCRWFNYNTTFDFNFETQIRSYIGYASHAHADKFRKVYCFVLNYKNSPRRLNIVVHFNLTKQPQTEYTCDVDIVL